MAGGRLRICHLHFASYWTRLQTMIGQTITACALTTGTLLLFALPSCTLATPFRGPGYSPSDGIDMTVATGDSVVVAITHARLDRAKKRLFFDEVDKIAATLDQQPGFIGSSLRFRVLGNEAWTLTAWRDEDSLLDFVVSDVHQDAIDVGRPATTLERTHHFEVPITELPIPWERALAALDTVHPRVD